MFDQNIADVEISDYIAEIGMLGEDEHAFFVQGGLTDQSTLEGSEWDNVCQEWERKEVAQREAELALSDQDWVISMTGWFGF